MARRDDQSVARATQVVVRNSAKYDPPDLAGAQAECFDYARIREDAAEAWIESVSVVAPLGDLQRYRLRELPDRENRSPWTSLLRIQPDSEPIRDYTGDGPSAGKNSFNHHQLTVPFALPHFFVPADIVRFVSDAAEAGVEFLEFEEVANIPSENLTPLKQAFRYGHRTGS